MIDENQPFWELMQCTSLNGRGVVTKWLKKTKQYDNFAADELETILNILTALRNERLWSMPEYRWMTNLEDIGEIRFQNKQRKQLRIFGIFLKEKRQYVMLTGALEDNKRYDPPETFKTALSRRQDVLNNDVLIIEFKFPEDEENDEDEDEY